MTMLAPLFSTLALLSPTTSVLTVDDDGPADFAQVRDAVLAAPEGATILVRPGLYRGFTLDGKGLRVIADNPGGAPVLIGGSLTADIDTTRVQNLAAGQEFVLQGVEVIADFELTSNQGNLWIEKCRVTGAIANGFEPARTMVTDCASVVFRDCELRGVSAGLNGDVAGLRVRVQSNVHLFDSSVLGASGAFDGGDGAWITDGSFLYAADTEFHGGDGVDLGDFPGCEPDGLATCLGGDGIKFSAGAEGVLINPTLSAGSGPNAPGQTTAVAASSNLTIFTRTPHRVRIASPLSGGQTASLELEGGADEVAWVVYANEPRTLYLASLLSVLALNPPIQSLAPQVLDASGRASLNVTPPFPGLGLARTLYVQALFYDAGAAPGFEWTLGAPSAVTILDPSL